MSEVVKKDCQNPNMLGKETQYMYAGNFESFRKFYENILILSLRSTPCILYTNSKSNRIFRRDKNNSIF